MFLSKAYFYGDSHGESSFKGFSMPHECRVEKSCTMHRVGRDKVIPNWKACSPRDTAVFSFGEVDCRAHIGKQIELGRTEDEVIDALTKEYIDTIRVVAHCRVIIVAVIPPTARKDYEASVPDGGFPFVSSDEDRLRYTRSVNNRLYELCRQQGFIFFDPYEPYTRDDGCLRRELSDGNVHIGDTRHVLANFKKIWLNQMNSIPIDSPDNEAFCHWVFESAILLPTLQKNIVLATKKTYKTLFCRYFGIQDEEIQYDPTQLAGRSFRLIDNPIPQGYPQLLDAFFTKFSSSVIPDVDFVVMPRQRKENYTPNDRPCPLTPFLDMFQTSGRTHRIVHTDDITDLQTQIDLVNSGRNLVVVDGAAFLVNGMFCSGKHIYVISCSLVEEQSKMYPMMKLLYDKIKQRNEVTFIKADKLEGIICPGDTV